MLLIVLPITLLILNSVTRSSFCVDDSVTRLNYFHFLCCLKEEGHLIILHPIMPASYLPVEALHPNDQAYLDPGVLLVTPPSID